MRALAQTALGLSAGAVWLLLLEVTDFNVLSVGLGLLVALSVMR